MRNRGVRQTAWREIGFGPSTLAVAIATGLVLRLGPILLADFPLSDGGLFVTMANDIRHAGFGLPDFSSYNAGDVPFAYPPLGLYLLALIPGDPISTERWLPLVWSLLAIPAAYLLARELVDERRAGLAALIFAAMPCTWAIEGGGVTRGLAFALLLFALWRVVILLKAPGVRNAATAGFLGGAAILTHPAVGPSGAATALLLLAFMPSRRGFAALVASGAIALVLAAPWLSLILSRYGVGAILAAATSHGQDDSLRRLLTFGPSWIGTTDFVLPLALLGAVITTHRREWLLPVWVVLMVLVPGAEGRYAALAWALLAATGAMAVVKVLTAEGALKAASIAGFVWLTVTSLGAGYRLFDSIPSAVREAMVEAGHETPPTATFAVFAADTGLEHAMLDWFPTLSSRTSVGTYMGLEWTTPERWKEALAMSYAINRGDIPTSATYIFSSNGRTATWGPAR